MPIDIIVFDFDGVLLDSVGIKTRAFGELFREHGPEAVRYVTEYHQKHGGVSRFVKFRHYYRKLLGRDITPEEMQKLSDRFNQLAMDQLVKSPMIPGAREFVDYAHGNWPLFVASGAPQVELDKLLRLMDIHGHFKEIHGSPPHKSVTLGDIIAREQAEPSRVLMIGDSETDLVAAQDNGTRFLGIGSFNGYPCIPDLTTARETIQREFGA